MLDIKYRFTCGDSDLSEVIKKCQNIMARIVIEPSFQEVSKFFILAFENDDQRVSNKGYYLPNVEIKDYNVIIDAIGHRDGYTTGCVLNYIYLKNYYKIIAINLSKNKR